MNHVGHTSISAVMEGYISIRGVENAV